MLPQVVHAICTPLPARQAYPTTANNLSYHGQQCQASTHYTACFPQGGWCQWAWCHAQNTRGPLTPVCAPMTVINALPPRWGRRISQPR